MFKLFYPTEVRDSYYPRCGRVAPATVVITSDMREEADVVRRGTVMEIRCVRQS
jgi:hypothetical protein